MYMKSPFISGLGIRDFLQKVTQDQHSNLPPSDYQAL